MSENQSTSQETRASKSFESLNRNLWWRRILILIAGVLIVMGLLRWAMGKAASVAKGVTENRLADCPDSPNCVCSHQTTDQHGITPLSFSGEPAEAWNKLIQVIREMPRTEIVSQSDNYLHATFTTALMGYVDDVECLLDPQNQQIQIRSASRIGHSDLGANRKRVEQIRILFTAE